MRVGVSRLGMVVLTLAACCLAPVAHAQTPESAACPPSAPVPSPALLQVGRQHLAGRGFLWRISRDGRDSFTYGTLLALPAATQAALLSAWRVECLDVSDLRSGTPEWHTLRLGLFPDFGAEAVLLMRNLRTEAERADFDRIITGRHPAMADGIERHRADQAVFVAVGALHLPGEQGLLALMRAKGFALTRVF